MKLYELLKDITFDEEVKFVSQDSDRTINTYNVDPCERRAEHVWTNVGFIEYWEDSNGNIYSVPLAEDYQTALHHVVNGKITELVDPLPKNNNEDEVVIHLTEEDFEYLVDPLECGEMVIGIVNSILAEKGIDIKFNIDFSEEE